MRTRYTFGLYLIVPWLALAGWLLGLIAWDHQRFTRTQAEELANLAQSEQKLLTAANEFSRQLQLLREQFIKVEEKSSYRQSVQASQERISKIREQLIHLPQARFFPRSYLALREGAQSLHQAENLLFQYWETKVEWLETKTKIAQFPQTLNRYHQSQIYHYHRGDFLNYMLMQEALAQGEKAFQQLQDELISLEQDLSYLEEEGATVERAVQAAGEKFSQELKRERNLVYTAYLQQKLHTFSLRQAWRDFFR